MNRTHRPLHLGVAFTLLLGCSTTGDPRAPALSTLDPAAQDGQANDLMNAFDFNQAPLPPLVLPPHSCN